MHFNLADLFELVVETVPDREALVCGERRLTYRALEERANRLAHWLAGRGVGKGDHVGLYLYNCTEFIEGMLACYKIRAVPININYRYVEEELRYLFDNADLVAVVHHRQFAPRIAAVAPGLPKLQTVACVEDGSGADIAAAGSVEYERALADGSAKRDFAQRSGDDIYIIYTGGTTGLPRGVMWRQEDIFFSAMGGGVPLGEPIARPEELRDKVREGTPVRNLLIGPLMHASQWGAFLFLYAGGCVTLSDRHHFDPQYLWELAAREKVNSLGIIGDAMGRPLAEALAEVADKLDLSSLMSVVSGGAIFSQPVKAQFENLLPDVMLFDAFGASETGVQGRSVTGAERPGSPAFAMDAHNQVFDDDDRPVPPGSGMRGRLALRGRIPLGYYKDEAKTAATFVTIDGQRWALPGDIATVETDGTITVFGRGSVSINSGGEKVFPEEVEAALKAHAAVFDVLVVGVPDARFGERVAAVVQARAGMKPTLDDIARHARSKLAAYKIPRELHLVEQVVRSPNGKPDYRWAKAAAESGKYRRG